MKSRYFIATYLGKLYEIPFGQNDLVVKSREQDVEIYVYDFNGNKILKKFPKGLIANVYSNFQDSEQLQIVEKKYSDKYRCSNSKRLFLFGAGASFNCVFDGDRKTGFPLTKDLMKDELLIQKLNKFYLGTHLLALSKLDNFNLEKEVESLLYELENVAFNMQMAVDLVCLNVAFGEYFKNKLSFITSGNLNLYNILVALLKKHNSQISSDENFLLVSFNYDTLLDTAISRSIGKDYSSLFDYISSTFNPFRYYKPHGSSNWGLEVKSNSNLGFTDSNDFIERILNKKVTYFNLLTENVIQKDQIVFDLGSHALNFYDGNNKSYAENFLSVIVGNAFTETNMKYPVILLPTMLKDRVLLPFSIQKNLENDLSFVEEIYVIGFAMNEDKFNSILKHNFSRSKKLQRIWIVDPTPAPIILKLRDVISIDQIEIRLCESFEKFVTIELPKILGI